MKTKVYSAVFVCVFSLLYGVLIAKVYIEDKRKLMQQIEPTFIYTIEEDLKERFDRSGIYYHYSYDPIRRDPTQDMSSIMNEQFHILHTILREEKPINVKALDSLFVKRLKEKGCTGQTAIEYIDHSSETTQKSIDDASFYSLAYSTPQIPLGYDSEMSLQGFVRISPLSVIQSAKEHYFLLLLVYLLSLAFALFFIRMRHRKTTTEEILKKPEEKQVISFNNQNNRLTNKQGEQISLTTQQALLIDYMLNAEDHYISNEQIKELLWDSKDFIGTSRQYQSIDRLRKKLEAIPEIKIVNEHGIGYALQIDDTVDCLYITQHTSLQSDPHISPE